MGLTPLSINQQMGKNISALHVLKKDRWWFLGSALWGWRNHWRLPLLPRCPREWEDAKAWSRVDIATPRRTPSSWKPQLHHRQERLGRRRTGWRCSPAAGCCILSNNPEGRECMPHNRGPKMTVWLARCRCQGSWLMSYLSAAQLHNECIWMC